VGTTLEVVYFLVQAGDLSPKEMGGKIDVMIN
jgi:hypothetical protein